MIRILIASLALCLLLLSAGKSYAHADALAFSGAHDMSAMHTCTAAMADLCDDMDTSDGLFSHFNCHLNITALVSGYSSIGLMGLSSPSYRYHFSSKVHIQALVAKPPQLT